MEWEKDSMEGEAGCDWETGKSGGDFCFKSGAPCQLCFLLC